MRSNNSAPTQLIVYLAGGFFIFIILGFLKPFVIVNAGERGVVMRFGKVQEVVFDEGLHPVVPLVTKVKTLSVRVQKNDINAEASSRDLQDIKMDIAVNWHIEPTQVNRIFQRVGDEEQIVFRIINPAVSEVVKAATAKKTAEEIITKRTELKQEIDNQLNERLASYGVAVDGVSLVNISFSPEFAKAIEAKQIAEQEAKRAEFEALKAEKQALAEVNRAKGQAEAQRLQRQTLTVELLQKQAIEKWDGKFPLVLGGEGALPFINIDSEELGK
ncbi:MAG: prohibitin family protein [Xenococcaceae cyanobacterium MO_207.B15]|nr:prohibitin family protein [Xenococcaceae cyanobacterium MO_207.B15]